MLGINLACEFAVSVFILHPYLTTSEDQFKKPLMFILSSNDFEDKNHVKSSTAALNFYWSITVL